MKKTFYILWLLVLPLCIQAQTSSVQDEVRRHIIRAQTAYEIGEYRRALEEYRNAQRLVPNFPDLHKAMGGVYEKLGSNDDLRMAIESYEQYLRLAPNSPDKIAIGDRIIKLRFRLEIEEERTQILDDFSGVWISDSKVSIRRSSII